MDIKVTLLGTGGSRPDPERNGSAVVVQLEKEYLLFDAGRGATRQLVKAGIQPEWLNAIFITHHHFDHIGSLADVLLSGWNNGGQKPPLIVGPKGTRQIVTTLLHGVYGDDIASRIGEATLIKNGRSDFRRIIEVRDAAPGLAAQGKEWRVFAAHVDHMHGLGLARSEWACYGYRLECGGKVIAFSGDTVDCEGVRALAHNADLLVQCCYLAAAEIEDARMQLVAEHVLACAPRVGQIAAKAGVKRLVLTHFRQKSLELLRSLEAEVRHAFGGELIMGQDLMVVTV